MKSKLEIAQERYPKGTIYIPIDLDGYVIREHKNGIEVLEEVYMYDSGNIDVDNVGYIFINNLNKWADIIKPNSKKLEEARKVIYGEDFRK